MRRLFTVTMVAAGMMLCGSLAQAQWGANGMYAPERVNALVHRVHEDLNRGYHSGWNFNGGDRGRLDNAERQLHEFAQKWHRGRFDKGELDDAIGSIQHVVDNNHMSGRERDALWEDLGALRRMREAYDRHEIGRW